MTAQDLTAILKKSITTPMNSKQRAEHEIRQTEREIKNLNNKLQEQKEALQNINKPRYVYEAECGDEMYDGCILISRIANRDECWAILGAPRDTIGNHNHPQQVFQPGHEWFLPTLEIIKSISYEEFPIPRGHYLTSTRCPETGRDIIFEYNGIVRSWWYSYAELNPSYKIWLVKLVKCKTHYSQNDSDYSY